MFRNLYFLYNCYRKDSEKHAWSQKNTHWARQTSLEPDKRPWSQTNIPGARQTSMEPDKHPWSQTNYPGARQTSLEPDKHPWQLTNIPGARPTSLEPANHCCSQPTLAVLWIHILCERPPCQGGEWPYLRLSPHVCWWTGEGPLCLAGQYTVNCIVHCALYTIHCILYCTLCNVHYTL